MQISRQDLKRLLLFLSVFYYAGFLGFFSRIFAGGTSDNLMAASAAGNAAKQVLGLVLLCLSIGLLIRENKQVLFSALRANVVWLALVGYFFCSIYWSYDPSISLRRIIAFTTLLTTCFALVIFFNAESLLLFLAKTIFVVALLGLLFVVIDPGQALEGEGARANTFRGIMNDKNAGARFYAYGFLILLGLGYYQKFRQKFMLMILFICVVLANSATALVMLVSGAGLIFLFSVLRTSSATVNLQRFVLICSVLACTAFITHYLYEYLLMALGRDPTLTNRTIIWELLDNYVQDEFTFGYGFGAFWASDAVSSFVERWGFIGNAHSGYYEAWLHGGLIGFVLIITVLAKTLKDLIRSYIHHPKGNLVAALIAIVVLQGLVNYVGFLLLNHNSPDFFIFTLVAFISSFLIIQQQVPQLRKLVTRETVQGVRV